MISFDHIETEHPVEGEIYVWDHVTVSVAASGFESKEVATIWAREHGPEYEVVDARRLTVGDR